MSAPMNNKPVASSWRRARTTTIPSELSILQYMHCSKCIAEMPSGVSAREYARIEIGFTAIGLQARCVRHEINILHVDFEDQRHPANTNGGTSSPQQANNQQTVAMPSLDEIEAASNRIATRKSEWAPEMLAEITAELLRGLVVHVRALEEKVMLESAALDKTNERIGVEELGRRQEIDIHGERLAALEAKVAAREQEMDRLRDAVVEAALAADFPPDYALTRWRGLMYAVNALRAHRAENAELRKRVDETATLTGPLVWDSDNHRLRAENEKLRTANENAQSVAREYEERIKAMQEQVAPPPGGGK